MVGAGSLQALTGNEQLLFKVQKIIPVCVDYSSCDDFF
jgi:hypothetical protein